MEQTAIKPNPSDIIKNLLANPVQAVVSIMSNKNLVARAESSKTEVKSKMSVIESLPGELGKFLRGLIQPGTIPLADEMVDKITKFAEAAVSQYKASIGDSLTKEVSQIESSYAQERDKAVGAIDSYLQGITIPPDSRKVSLKLVSGAYDARGTYRITRKFEKPIVRRGFMSKTTDLVSENVDLSYEFSLRAGDVDIFKGVVYFSSIAKGFKLPVRSATSWVSKEAVIDYEKLDKYLLTEGELSGNTLLLTFTSDQGDHVVKLSYSFYEDNPILGVQYADGTVTSDIMTQPALANVTDTAVLSQIMSTFYGTFSELGNHRQKLTKLLINDLDVLSTLDFQGFLVHMAKLVAAEVNRLRQANNDTSPMAPILDSDFVKERLGLLGPLSVEIAEILSVGIKSSG
ncbi:MAG: hypothetical protein M1533_02360 [Candidatus Thermoplasmatota archaeon]|jgi:hypothetical protein|nr:hypothetical protein [Candidatus Thermoplasmatota archaeon]MCL5794293.1 hypothetical protein [Candidatus Thermoplasmatota archaeon]